MFKKMADLINAGASAGCMVCNNARTGKSKA